MKWIEVRDHIQMNPFHVLEDPLLHPPHTALWFDHLFRDTQIFIQGVWDTTRMGGCGLEISLTDFVFTMGVSKLNMFSPMSIGPLTLNRIV